MRAIQVNEHGGPEVLKIADVDPPKPGAADLLVDVAAAGVNYIDTYHRSGAYPTKPPFVPGLEGAGTVRAVGPDVTGFAVGDRVAWGTVPASYAEQVVLPATDAVAVPDGVDDRTAAASMLQGMTAQYLLKSTYPVQPGDTVLIHAAAGGVGLLLTEWAKHLGARVIGTVSTAAKEELARSAGADEIIRYTERDVADEVRRLTDGAGVHVVYDGVGKDTFEASLASLRRRGMLVLFGASSGPVPPFDLQRLNSGGSLFVTRPTLVHHTAERDELVWRAGEVFDAVAAGKLTIRISHTYPLADAAQAHADLQARRTTAKLLLIP
ncbi:MAG TPA: quinone oxidoreductase [Pseudonocardiaceae bacterium]